MGQNRGKSIDDMIVEREAEQAYQRALMNLPRSDSVKASIMKSRKRVTALGNAIQKINRRSE